MRPVRMDVPPPIAHVPQGHAREAPGVGPQEARPHEVARRAHLDDVQGQELDGRALGKHLHAHGPAPGAQVGLGAGVDGDEGHADGGGGAHGQDQRGAVGSQDGQGGVGDVRGEAEVGVDLVVEGGGRGGLVAQTDVVDEDGEVEVLYEGGEGGGVDVLVFICVEDEDED